MAKVTWKPIEKRLLKDGLKAGKTPRDIAVELPGRSMSSIYSKAWKMGFRLRNKTASETLAASASASKPSPKHKGRGAGRLHIRYMGLDESNNLRKIFDIRSVDEFFNALSAAHPEIPMPHVYYLWTHRTDYVKRIDAHIAKITPPAPPAPKPEPAPKPVGKVVIPGTNGTPDMETILVEILNEQRVGNRINSDLISAQQEGNRIGTELLATWKQIQEILTKRNGSAQPAA